MNALRRIFARSATLLALKRQWPFYRPRAVITNLESWIEQRWAAIGWYGAQSDAAFTRKFESSARLLRGYSRDADQKHVQRRVWNIPRSGVLTLRDAYVYSDRGYVLSSENELINEFSPGWSVDIARNSSFPGVAFATFAWTIRDLPGVSGVLACDGAKSHYHFLFQLLPRAHLCHDFLPVLDRVIVPSYLNENQVEALAECGVNSRTIYRIQPTEKLRLDYLVAPSIPSDRGAIPTWVIRFLRNTWLDSAQQFSAAPAMTKSSHVYLYRGKGYCRSIINEDEIVANLEKLGFDIVDCSKLSIRMQANALKHAVLIVAPHGAALANMVFARQPAEVIELFHPDHVYTQYYQNLSEIMGFAYEAIVLDREASGDASANLSAVLLRIEAAMSRDLTASQLNSTTQGDQPCSAFWRGRNG